MNQSRAETTAAVTFVVRFRREWAGGDSRRRNWVARVESGQQAKPTVDPGSLAVFLIPMRGRSYHAS
jgi:hypothetical protein